MPYCYEHCDPEYVLTLTDGTRICRDYKDGDQSQPLSCWYQLKDKSRPDGWASFDVRDLPPGDTHEKRIHAASHAAQKAGLSFLAYLCSRDIEVYDAYG